MLKVAKTFICGNFDIDFCGLPFSTGLAAQRRSGKGMKKIIMMPASGDVLDKAGPSSAVRWRS